MNASVAWLSAFVDSGLTPPQLRDLITGRVATVDALEPLHTELSPFIVGRVLTAERHPESDHLWVTTVDAGGPAPLDVICGAANVTAGVKYPFAPVGTTMPDGRAIKKAKIRGRVSEGMLCSARELGLGQDGEGILALETDAKPGTPLLDALRVADARLVVDILPNRPDLLSHRGLAREIAAATGAPLRDPAEPGVAAITPPKPVTDQRILVEHMTDAETYIGVDIEGVRIAKSPAWLAERLAAVGVRSINNVVDATNYMLHGYGQPMHAFDRDRLAGPINIRRAQAGERLVTLDGVERKLDAEMVVIADATGAQALAGVMGGQASEVHEGTTNLFLEIATFDARRTRRTRRILGLSTDASYRYERGVPAELPQDVYARAVSLIVAVAGGVVHPPSMLRAPKEPRGALTLRAKRVERLLGVPVAAKESAALLEKIGFEVQSVEGDLVVRAPWFRPDIDREIDLIEEVARLRGYDSFPTDLRPYRPSAVPDAPLVAVSRRVRDAMVAEGFLEARPIPFTADGANGAAVRIRNPMADDEPYLRTSVLPSLAARAVYNLHRKQGDLRLFEIGVAFARGSAPRPDEEVRVAALMMGARRPPHFTEPDPPAFDEWDAKAIAERLVATTQDRPAEFRPGKGDVLWEVVMGGALIGTVSRVTLDAPAWAKPAYGVELLLERTETADVAAPGHNAYGTVDTALKRRQGRKFDAPPEFPAVERDVSLLVPDTLAGGAGTVEAMIRKEGGLLESIALVSEYRGPGVPEAARSVTWRLTFRHRTRTLTEKEVDAWQRKLLRTLETELSVRQRTA